MCGIFAYSGPREAAPVLLEGLENLEYRGYDSSGLAFFKEGKIQCFKAAGDLARLKKKLHAKGIALPEKSLSRGAPAGNASAADSRAADARTEKSPSKIAASSPLTKSGPAGTNKGRGGPAPPLIAPADTSAGRANAADSRAADANAGDSAGSSRRPQKSAKPSNLSLGIGHTRWAVHGAPSERNAHPHRSGPVYIVHNGVIENEKELRERPFKTRSQTDSELIACLIDFFFQKEGDFFQAVLKAEPLLEGAFAVAAISEKAPGRLAAFKQGPPLLLCRGRAGAGACGPGACGGGGEANEFFICSDPQAPPPRAAEALFLQDGDKLFIEGDHSFRLINKKGEQVKPRFVPLNNREEEGADAKSLASEIRKKSMQKARKKDKGERPLLTEPLQQPPPRQSVSEGQGGPLRGAPPRFGPLRGASLEEALQESDESAMLSKLSSQPPAKGKGGFPHFMLKEIFEQLRIFREAALEGTEPAGSKKSAEGGKFSQQLRIFREAALTGTEPAGSKKSAEGGKFSQQLRIFREAALTGTKPAGSKKSAEEGKNFQAVSSSETRSKNFIKSEKASAGGPATKAPAGDIDASAFEKSPAESRPHSDQSGQTLRTARRRFRFSPEAGDFAALTAGASELVICACGSSFHAALSARYIMESLAGLKTSAEISSEFIYRRPVLSPQAVFLFISQSGETADTLAALKLVREKGLKTVSLCNTAGSSLDRLSDISLYMNAGPETAVAAAKSFTASLLQLSLLTLQTARLKGRLPLSKESAFAESFAALPFHIEEIFKQETLFAETASKLKRREGFFYLGRGPYYPIALEGALKLKEITYIHAEACPAGEMKHGPLALIDRRKAVVGLIPEKSSPLYRKTIVNLREAEARGASIVAAGGAAGGEAAAFSHFHFPSPQGPEGSKGPAEAAASSFFHPLLSVISLQLFAYFTARELGRNVDRPRNLAKSVTVE